MVGSHKLALSIVLVHLGKRPFEIPEEILFPRSLEG